MPAPVLGANIGLAASTTEMLSAHSYWSSTVLDGPHSVLTMLNFTMAGVLLLVLAGLGSAGIEVWQRTTRLRRMLATAIVSSSAVAFYDWHGTSSYKDGRQDASSIVNTMLVGLIVATALALLSLARPALHIGVQLLAEDTVRAERARLRRAEQAK